MTDTKHPEALRLAALYDADAWPGGLSLNAWAAASAAELRRLHAENTTLQQDAEDAARYRWLRDGCDTKGSAASRIASDCYGLEWDKLIDAARARGAQGESNG